MVDKIKINPQSIRPQILVCGNGIERGYGSESWEKIIKRMLKENDSTYMYDDIKDLPANMQVVIASGNQLDSEMGKLKNRLIEFPVVEEHKNFYKKYAELDIDAIFTTNYDFHIEQSFGCKTGEYWYQRTRKWTKDVPEKDKKFHLYQYSLVNKEYNIPIWHIHGDVCNKESMIMGHYYYGKLLGRIEKRGNDFVRWYKAAITKNADIYADSWVDLFLTGDLYVIGLQMYFTEIDLWWLIDYKYKIFPDSRIYYYQPNGCVDSSIKKMLGLYPKISIVDDFVLRPTKDDVFGYKAFYSSALDNIKKRISVIKEV